MELETVQRINLVYAWNDSPNLTNDKNHNIPPAATYTFSLCRHDLGFPLLAPIRNSCELRGLCCRSCFRPRTRGRSITISSKRFGDLHQGFPFSLVQCRQGRTRMGGWDSAVGCNHLPESLSGPCRRLRYHETQHSQSYKDSEF